MVIKHRKLKQYLVNSSNSFFFDCDLCHHLFLALKAEIYSVRHRIMGNVKDSRQKPKIPISGTVCVSAETVRRGCMVRGGV
jgi:hypothetical protein